jgi:hypothetical protein
MYYREALVSRILLIIALDYFTQNFIKILQIILIVEAIVAALILFFKTSEVGLFHFQSFLHRLNSEFYQEPKPLKTAMQHATQHATSQIINLIPITTEVKEVGEEFSDYEIFDVPQLESKPKEVEKLKNGNWKIDNEERTEEKIRSLYRAYKSRATGEKVSQSQLVKYNYWKSVIEIIDNEKKETEQIRNKKFSESIKDI